MPGASLRTFVAGMTRLVDRKGTSETDVLDHARDLLSSLVSQDDWLPEPFAAVDPARYRQYLLYGDPLERFCLVSFVWGPGQSTPIHDHLTWGLIGMLRGEEESIPFTVTDYGVVPGTPSRLRPGMTEAVSPRLGDIHRVSNALCDAASISIHLYGGNIGAIRRHSFDPETGRTKDFVSGYSSAFVPSLWS